MRSSRGIIATIMLLCGTQAAAAPEQCPAQIRIAFTDASLPPFVLGEGADFHEPPGLFVSWTRTALARLGCSQVATFSRLPYNRIIANITAGTIDLRVTGGYRKDLEDIMVFPMSGDGPNRALAAAETGTTLYVLKDSRSAEWDGKAFRFSGPNPTVGTVRGHYTEKVAETHGFRVDPAPTWEANIKKLQAGRVAAIIGPEAVVDAFPERAAMRKLEPPVAIDTYFAPASRRFYARYPEFTLRFWMELCLESRGTFPQLPPCSIE